MDPQLRRVDNEGLAGPQVRDEKVRTADRGVWFCVLALLAAGCTSSAGVSSHAATSMPARTRSPSPSARVTTSSVRNGKIAYMCGMVICVVNPNGSHLEKIDNGLHRYAPEWEPAWSADGTTIAFRGYFGPGEGSYALFSMNADGSDLTRLQNGGEQPSWSPDGRQIVYQAGGVRVMNADGSDSRPLIRPPARLSLSGSGQPSWSPSKNIVFVGWPKGTNTDTVPADSLYVVHPNGAGLTQIPNTQGAVSPAWSPDGSTIVFYRMLGAYKNHLSGIYTVRPDGSHLTEVVPPTGQAESPVFTPDGRAIAYFFGTGDRNGVYVVRLDGTGNHRLDVPIDTPEFTWQPVP